MVLVLFRVSALVSAWYRRIGATLIPRRCLGMRLVGNIELSPMLPRVNLSNVLGLVTVPPNTN